MTDDDQGVRGGLPKHDDPRGLHRQVLPRLLIGGNQTPIDAVRSLIDRLVDPGLDRGHEIVASALGVFLGVAIGLGTVVVSPMLIDTLFG